MNKIWQKIKNISFHVYITGTILSIVLIVFLVDLNKKYTVETTLIVLPKSEMAAIELEKITNNIAAFPKMLSFYDRMLTENPKLIDPFENMDSAARQKSWQANVETKSTKYSRTSLVTVSVSANTLSNAKSLSTKSTQTLFAVTSKYYNFNSDLDMRVANGPIMKTSVSFFGWIVLLGIILGMGIALLLEEILLILERVIIKQNSAKTATSKLQNQFKSLRDSFFKPQIPEIKNIEEIYVEHEDKNIKIEKTFPELEEIHKKKQEGVYPNFPEMPLHSQEKKASAPENLPIYSEADFKFENIENVPKNLPVMENDIIQEEKLEEKKVIEPTTEELKKRLNQLLRGD